MSDIIKNLTSEIQSKIDSYEPQMEVRNVGTVLEAGDGIARATGLAGVKSQELVEFENGVIGIAFNLEEEKVGIIILGEYSEIHEG
ncbi:MAG TPA: F0F1 ATP synthase subunit alpha, partial [Anaerolineaceae bacterium]|nr:F0F1 ATP synthase subunit alpha [Anaerolineaceae bacterium]